LRADEHEGPDVVPLSSPAGHLVKKSADASIHAREATRHGNIQSEMLILRI
jgi:hypothetical protein